MKKNKPHETKSVAKTLDGWRIELACGEFISISDERLLREVNCKKCLAKTKAKKR